jgi:cyclopropane fatty-acyl-phospholipid synthase-like methyltransferase
VRTARVDLLGDWHELGDFRADVIVALDVLEHFADDGAFVAKLRRHLEPGGRIVLKVPAQSRLYGAIDEASGHFRRYDAQPLAQLLAAHGFRTLALRHMNAAGAWGYRLKRRRRTGFSLTFSPGKLRCVNALIPALALLDRLPGLKGLSLVGVFELQR